MTATLFACPFRELLAGDLKTVLDGEIAEPDFWAAVCVSGARLIDDLRDSLTPAPCYASMSQVKCDPLCQKPAVQPLYQGAEGAITPLTLWQPRRARASPRYEEVRFAMDSPLEGAGFELSVPREGKLRSRDCRVDRDGIFSRKGAGSGRSAGRFEPFPLPPRSVLGTHSRAVGCRTTRPSVVVSC